MRRELWHRWGQQRDRGTDTRTRMPHVDTRTGLLLPWNLFHGWPAQFSSKLITCDQIRTFSTRFLMPLFQRYW